MSFLAPAVYQQRIEGLVAVNAEQGARIKDLAARVESLERDKAELFAALRREQTLRALPVPTAAEMPVTETQAQEVPEAPGDAQTGTVVQDQAQAAERTEEAGPLGPGNWWARLWRRE